MDYNRLNQLISKGEYGISFMIIQDWLAVNYNDVSALEYRLKNSTNFGKENHKYFWAMDILKIAPHNITALEECLIYHRSENPDNIQIKIIIDKLLKINPNNTVALETKLTFTIDEDEAYELAIDLYNNNIGYKEVFRIIAMKESREGNHIGAEDYWVKYANENNIEKKYAFIGARSLYNAKNWKVAKKIILNNVKIEELNIYDNTDFGILDLLMRAHHSLHEWKYSHKISQILRKRNYNHKNSITCMESAERYLKEEDLEYINKIEYSEIKDKIKIMNHEELDDMLRIIKNQDLEILNEIINTEEIISIIIQTKNIIIGKKNIYDGEWLFDVLSSYDFLRSSKRMRHFLAELAYEFKKPKEAFEFCLMNLRMMPQDSLSAEILHKTSMMISENKILEAADYNLSQRQISTNINWGIIASTCIRNGKIEIAREILDQYRMRLDKFGHRVRIGISFFIDKNMTEVIEKFESMGKQFQVNSEFILLYGLALARTGRLNKSIEAINNVRVKSEKYSIKFTIFREIGMNIEAFNELNKLYEDSSKINLKWHENDFAFDAISTEENKKNYENGELVTVIMGIHKWNKYFPLAVNSILMQTHSNIELIIFDDGSTKDDFKAYEKICKDRRIKLIRNKKNMGIYYRRNQGIKIANGKYITFADSDDWSHPERIEKSIKGIANTQYEMIFSRYLRINDKGFVHLDGGRTARFALVSMFWKAHTLKEKIGYFDNVRVSGDSELYERAEILIGKEKILRSSDLLIFALHHDKSLTTEEGQEIDWMGPTIERQKYALNYRKWHKTIDENYEIIENGLPIDIPSKIMIRSKENEYGGSIIKKLISKIKSPKNNNINYNNIEINPNNESIIVCMATYPGGFSGLKRTVESLLSGQNVRITKLKIHVNGVKIKIPELPKDERLEVNYSKENLTDMGKFAMTEGELGYIFTVDDDIIYPDNYIQEMIKGINYFDKKIFVGVHGADLPVGPPITRWSHYKDMRRSHPFGYSMTNHTNINLIGTGTMAYHSSLIEIPWRDFKELKMADLHIGVLAQKNNIPMYIIPRYRGWMKEVGEPDERIWETANADKELQNGMIEVISKVGNWKKYRYNSHQYLSKYYDNLNEWNNRELPLGMQISKYTGIPRATQNNKVTIYIPMYNAAKYIVETIQSALSQNYENFEICVHDDGSTDDSLKLVRETFGNEEKVKITSSENKGIGSASNSAISNGDGEFILQLDSDDIINSNTIEKLISEMLRDSNIVCCYGNFRRINEQNQDIDQGWENLKYSRERLMRSMIIHPPRMFLRSGWEKINGFDEELINAVDYDFFLKLSEVSNFKHIRDNLYSYRIHSQSTSIKRKEIQTDNTKVVLQRTLKRNKLENDYVLHAPNELYPRRLEYIHISDS